MERLLIWLFSLAIFFLAFAPRNTFAQGEFLYTNNQVYPEGNSVSAFSIAANGNLIEIPSSPFQTGGSGGIGGGFSIRDILVFGRFLFVANSLSSNISVFSIDPATGGLSLVPGSPFPTGGGSNSDDGMSLATTPDGRFLMADNSGTGTIAVLRVGANGALSPVPGSPFPFAGNDLKVTPDGKFLLASGAVLVGFDPVGEITILSISLDGALTPVPNSPFVLGVDRLLGGIYIRCDGKIFVGEAGGSTVVDVLDIASSGSLSPIFGSPFTTSIGLNSCDVLLSPDERFLFVSNQFSDSVTVFDVGTSGSLTPTFGSFFNVRVQTPLNMITNGAGTTLYVASFRCAIEALSVAGNGSLTQLAGFPICVNVNGASNLHSLAVYPARTCTRVPSFDLCVQDDSNGDILRINSTTGEYHFMNCSGFTADGAGVLKRKGSMITLQQYASDRRVFATIDGSANKGTASIQVFSQGRTWTIIDRNTRNNTCSCR